MSFTTYLESWGSLDPITQVQEMINNSALKPNSRIVLAFASFNFDSSDYIPGLQNISMDSVKNLVNLVHSHNAKISLSIGGATYYFGQSDLYNKPGILASNINRILTNCGFDGVDFDIEDSYIVVPANFATQAASVINTLRSLNKNLYITLTTACQAWSSGMYQQSLLNMTIGNINAWQPMEYDLWIDPTSNYISQIEWDINYYLTTWKVDPTKIIMGLMPGNDDMGHILSFQDALSLTSFAKTQNLQGIMIWNLNIDSEGIDNNAPYTFTIGIQSQISKKPLVSSCCSIA